MFQRGKKILFLVILFFGGVFSMAVAEGSGSPQPLASTWIDPPNLFHKANSIATSPALQNMMVVSLQYSPSPRISLTGGRSWFPVGTAPWDGTDAGIERIAIAPRADPVNPLRILVAISNNNPDGLSIFRTGDFGQSWAEMVFPRPSKCNYPDIFNRLSASPADPTRLYFSKSCYYFDGWNWWEDIGEGFFSQDAGFSFQQLQEGYSNTWPFGQDLIPSPVNSMDVYNGTFQVSHDGGNTWSGIDFPYGSLVLDGKSAQRMVIVGDQWSPGSHSIDGGVTWHTWASFPCINPPIQAMADPNFKDTFYLTCSEGLFRSQDGGDHWTQLSHFYGRWIGPDYSVYPPRILWIRNDGLWASADAGTNWTHVSDFYQSRIRTSWENTSPPDPLGDVRGIRAVDEENVWAITGSGNILHWGGQEWESFQTGITPLTSLSFDGNQNGWTVGSGEAIHWDGSSWQATILPIAKPDLKAVDVTGSAAWAVGGGGVILEWDGSSWGQPSSPITDTLTAVEMVSATRGWAGGGNFEDMSGYFHGVLLQRTAGGWSMSFNSSQYVITGISALDDNNAWAVGSKVMWRKGYILHWNGVEWQEVGQFDHELYAISMSSSTDGWAIGTSVLLHWNGIDWQPVWDWTFGDWQGLWKTSFGWYPSVSTLPSGHTWFSGSLDDSFVFRYTGPLYDYFLPLMRR